MAARPDPRPERRVRDPELLAQLHLEWDHCALCGEVEGRLSLHHVIKHPRDDVRGNLVMLCGDGTTGCHGAVENHDPLMLAELAWLIFWDRPDVLRHMNWRLGPEAAIDRISRDLQGLSGRI